MIRVQCECVCVCEWFTFAISWLVHQKSHIVASKHNIACREKEGKWRKGKSVFKIYVVTRAEAEAIVEKGSKKQTKLMNKEATLIVYLSWSIEECILWVFIPIRYTYTPYTCVKCYAMRCYAMQCNAIYKPEHNGETRKRERTIFGFSFYCFFLYSFPFCSPTLSFSSLIFWILSTVCVRVAPN